MHPWSDPGVRYGARCERIDRIMVWTVIAVPLLIMFFALFMERVEARLRNVAVQEAEVEAFLEQARPEEVRALYGHGIGSALELFRGRRVGRSSRTRSRRSRDDI